MSQSDARARRCTVIEANGAKRRSRAGCPSDSAAPGRLRVSGTDFDRDLPQLLPSFQPLERGTRLGERKHAIHDRTQLTRAQQAYDLAILRVVPPGRAPDAPLVPEHPAQVERDVGTGRGPARHEPPAATEGSQRLVPRRLAH